MLAFIPPVFVLTIFITIVVIAGGDTARYDVSADERAQSAEVFFSSLEDQITFNRASLSEMEMTSSVSGVQDVSSLIKTPYPFNTLNNFRMIRTSTRVGDSGSRAFLIITAPVQVPSDAEPGEAMTSSTPTGMNPNDAGRLRRYVETTFEDDLLTSGTVFMDGGLASIGTAQFQHMRQYLSNGDIAFVVSLDEGAAL